MSDQFGLPRNLGNGLTLRWATPADTEEIAAFNLRIHSDDPENPEHFLIDWTRDLMSGNHPTTQASDFTVVTDDHDGGKIVSTLCLIGQTWAYEGIPFGVGRPELVGTDAAYRRRGLVRAQFEAIHALSASRGHMVQAITGVPWYYRQFGYEMTVNLGGGRNYRLGLHKESQTSADEPYKLRPASVEDIPFLQELYAHACADGLLTRLRDAALWRYEMTEAHRTSEYSRHFYVVEETAVSQPVAYVEYRDWGQSFGVRELSVRPGHSLRAVALFLIRSLEQEAVLLNPERKKPYQNIHFHFGESHPVYEALARELPTGRPPYAWYIRVADLPGFLRHIAPVLETRLQNSVMAGHSGAVKLNFYRSQLTMVFDKGKLVDLGTYEPERLESGDALFPELTFLKLLFGHRSLDELDAAFADCYANNETAVLLPILFPKRPSRLIELG